MEILELNNAIIINYDFLDSFKNKTVGKEQVH